MIFTLALSVLLSDELKKFAINYFAIGERRSYESDVLKNTGSRDSFIATFLCYWNFRDSPLGFEKSGNLM